VTKITLLIWLYKLDHYFLDLYGIFQPLIVKPETSADSYTVRIRNNGGLFIEIAKQQICYFSAYARKFKQILHIVGHYSVKITDEHCARGNYVLCFHVIKTARAHYVLHVLDARVGE
jgi:hypothetical protein